MKHRHFIVSTTGGQYWAIISCLPDSLNTNTNLLEEGGELLRHISLGSLVPQSDLLDGVLQELGHLQFDSQLRF